MSMKDGESEYSNQDLRKLVRKCEIIEEHYGAGYEYKVYFCAGLRKPFVINFRVPKCRISKWLTAEFFEWKEIVVRMRDVVIRNTRFYEETEDHEPVLKPVLLCSKIKKELKEVIG